MHRSILFVLPLLVLSVFHPLQTTTAKQILVSSTPTYDPLAEPPFPERPTEYELGRNLYWHWCMTCHGDKGQGLTDEFRSIWDKDHQNCWGRGCHAGHNGDMGFPIPTIVPALVDRSHLDRFDHVEDLSDFLKATHPPQSPGILKDEEYHAIAVFVFTMNDRSPITIPVTSTSSPMPTLTAIPTQTQTVVSQRDPTSTFPFYAVIIFFILMIGFFGLARKHRVSHQ